MTTTATEPALALRGITKSFFGTTVLDDVTLEVAPGEIHALVGENGAGKSTLMKVLAGVYEPDAGRVVLGGEPVRFRQPRQALAHGISLVHQEFSLLPQRTVAENVFLGREPRRRFTVDRRAMARETARLLAGTGIASNALVRTLSVAQQQHVEIAKALSYAPKILVLDEPTAALTPAEAEVLFTRLRELVADGLTVLYISHRLAEIFALADRVTVLKDGKLVDTRAVADVLPEHLVHLMVGREMSSHYFPPRASGGDRPVRVSVRGGAAPGIRRIDLELRGGEITGVAGLDGAGRAELTRALFGVRPFTAGEYRIDGRVRRITGPRKAIRAGVALLTADRKAEGLVLSLSTMDNGLLAARALGRGPAADAVRAWGGLAGRVGLAPGASRQESRFLSGGNQQKAVLAKWLTTGAAVYLFEEPTRGIDVGAKAGIHELMRELADGGAAVLMISSDLPEVIGMSDRILVMRGGEIAGELPAGASEPEVMKLATAS